MKSGRRRRGRGERGDERKGKRMENEKRVEETWRGVKRGKIEEGEKETEREDEGKRESRKIG